MTSKKAPAKKATTTKTTQPPRVLRPDETWCHHCGQFFMDGDAYEEHRVQDQADKRRRFCADPKGLGMVQDSEGAWSVPAPEDRGEKHCTHCGKLKPLTDFYRSVHSRDKHTSRCKECEKAKVRAYRERHKQEASA